MTKVELIALAEVEDALATHYLALGTANATSEYEAYLGRENMRRYHESLCRAAALRAIAEGMNDDD